MAELNGSTWRWAIGGLGATFVTVTIVVFTLMAAMNQRLARVEADRVTHSEHADLTKLMYELTGNVAALAVQIRINTGRIENIEYRLQQRDYYSIPSRRERRDGQ